MKMKSNSKKILYFSFVLVFLLPLSLLSSEYDSLQIDYNFIDSNPQNAKVYIDDHYEGNTPLFFIWKDTLFPKNIKIEFGNLIVYTEIINNNIKYKKNILLNIKENKKLVTENKQIFFKTPRKLIPIIILSIITAGSGISAYYFKTLANEKLKEYEFYNDESILNKKKKYDLISGASIILLQAGLTSLIYFLFID